MLAAQVEQSKQSTHEQSIASLELSVALPRASYADHALDRRWAEQLSETDTVGTGRGEHAIRTHSLAAANLPITDPAFAGSACSSTSSA
ncbi:hypothetical protein ON010_g5285 [Phytophthora cinnamomi]|nr:hypothetical protein ON010_g5285 [Phytophthora cinnamomi]